MMIESYQTKSNIIYQEIKRDIISGKYEPNERIVISEIAKEFGASDIPVREAMRQLESDGLIRNKPYVGAVVTTFELSDIQKIYQIRAQLEGMATRLATQNIEPKELNMLQKIVAKMERAYKSENYGLLATLNSDFHDVIYTASGNEYLKKVIFELWDLSLRARAIFMFMPDRAREAVAEHKKLLTALKEKQGDRAEELVINHMQSHLNALQLFFEQMPNQPEGANE